MVEWPDASRKRDWLSDKVFGRRSTRSRWQKVPMRRRKIEQGNLSRKVDRCKALSAPRPSSQHRMITGRRRLRAGLGAGPCTSRSPL